MFDVRVNCSSRLQAGWLTGVRGTSQHLPFGPHHTVPGSSIFADMKQASEKLLVSALQGVAISF